MKKKYLILSAILVIIIVFVIILVSLKNNSNNILECTKIETTDIAEYNISYKFIYKKAGTDVDSSVNITFNRSEDAEKYHGTMKVAYGDYYNIKRDGNILSISKYEENSEDANDKNSIKEKMESNGYICK